MRGLANDDARANGILSLSCVTMSFGLPGGILYASRTRHAARVDRPFDINVPLAFRCTAVGVEQDADRDQLYLSQVQRGLPKDVGPD